MPPPVLLHTLCKIEVQQMTDAWAQDLLDYLILNQGPTAELQDITLETMRNALRAVISGVWSGDIDVDVWEAHTLDPWPMPPYDGPP